MKKTLAIILAVLFLAIITSNPKAETLSFVDEEEKVADESPDLLDIVIPDTESVEKGKVLIVICNKDFQDNELNMPAYIFRNAGYKIEIASPEKDKCTGVAGDELVPDFAISEVNCEDYLAISIAGGPGSMNSLWKNSALIDLVKKFDVAGKPVGAISESPAILAIAQVLRKRNATVLENKDTIREFRRNGVRQQKSPVVPDGNIVTASAPYTAKFYAETLLSKVESGLTTN